jgi:poly(ribitol-phosphate) beta-N-acetylglucosaminyltransferase
MTKVSVVVPVFNAGSSIDGLVESLRRQTLAPGEMQVVFVDDGSTDETWDSLQRLAATEHWAEATTIPNSGWPGRPRNVGLGLATGDYVFFADHDDRFFPEALERMHAHGVRNESDIVYGKLVRLGRTTPYWPLWQQNVGNAPVTVDVLSSRTVHKLFRRSFLAESGARFPEGRVRVEDHNFMAQVLPLAKVVSILADYPCYQWIYRNDAAHTSNASVEASVYWNDYTEVLRIFERVAGPGELLDSARVIAAVQAFSRFPPKRYLQRTPPSRANLVAAAHTYVTQQVPEELDPRVPVLKRIRIQALRANDASRFDQLQEMRTRISFPVQLDEVRWRSGRLQLSLSVALSAGRGKLLPLKAEGDDLMLEVEPPLGGFVPDQLRLLPSDRGTVEVTVRHRTSGVEWPVRGSQTVQTVPRGSGVGLRVRAEVEIDPSDNSFGAPLEAGIWDVLLRVQFLGESLVHRLEATTRPAPDPTPQRLGERTVVAYRTDGGTLALGVSGAVNDAAGNVRPTVDEVRWDGDRLRVTLLPVDGGEPAVLGVRTRGRPDLTELPMDSGHADVLLPPSEPGDIVDFFLLRRRPGGQVEEQRIAYSEGPVAQRAPYRIYATAHGSLSVRHEPPITLPTVVRRAKRRARRLLTKVRRGS